METINLPPPQEIEQRVKACEEELRELKRLLRASRAWHKAQDARRRRQEVPHAS